MRQRFWLCAMSLALIIGGSPVRAGEPSKEPPPYDRTGGMQAVYFGAKGEIRAVVLLYSAETRNLNAAWVVDPRTGKQLVGPLQHKAMIRQARISPDGKYVATAGEDQRAVIWDVTTGKVRAELSHKKTVAAAVFSPDSQRIVTSSDDGTAQVWDVATGQRIGASLVHGQIVQYALFSPDGKRVVTAAREDRIIVWDATTGKQVMTYEHKVPFGIRHVVFSPDGLRMASAGDGRVGMVWDVASGKALARLENKHVRDLNHIVFSADGKQVATCAYDGTARVWDATTGKHIAACDNGPQAVDMAMFSNDGQRLLAAHVGKKLEANCLLWDITHGTKLLTIPCPSESSRVVATFSPDDRLVVVVPQYALPFVVDATNGKRVGSPASK